LTVGAVFSVGVVVGEKTGVSVNVAEMVGVGVIVAVIAGAVTVFFEQEKTASRKTDTDISSILFIKPPYLSEI
jgi:hypothetical protein